MAERHLAGLRVSSDPNHSSRDQVFRDAAAPEGRPLRHPSDPFFTDSLWNEGEPIFVAAMVRKPLVFSGGFVESPDDDSFGWDVIGAHRRERMRIRAQIHTPTVPMALISLLISEDTLPLPRAHRGSLGLYPRLAVGF